MTLDISTAPETPAEEPRARSGGPAIKTRNREQYEDVLALQARVAPASFLKDFAPRLIDAGLAAMSAHPAAAHVSEPDVHPTAQEYNDALRMLSEQGRDIERLRADGAAWRAERDRALSDADDAMRAATAAREEIERLRHASDHGLSRGDHIRAAISGAKTADGRDALDVLNDVHTMLRACRSTKDVDMLGALVNAIDARLERLNSLAKAKTKGKPAGEVV